jgi:YidC/Oxa1 family membrane protein insertase
MNFDRNTVIGFIILALLFFGYFYFNNQQQLAYQKEKTRQDSIAKANLPKSLPNTGSATTIINRDTTLQQQQQAGFQQFSRGAEQMTTVSNGVLKISFSNKGGQPGIN